MTVHFTCVESVFLCTSKFTLKVVGSCYENGLLDILYLCTLQESLRFSNLINSRLKFSTLRVFSNQNISDSTQSNRNTEGCMVCYDKRTLFTTNDKSWHQQPTKNNNKKHWIAFSGLRRRIPVRILRLCSRAIASLVGTMCFFFFSVAKFRKQSPPAVVIIAIIISDFFFCAVIFIFGSVIFAVKLIALRRRLLGVYQCSRRRAYPSSCPPELWHSRSVPAF